MSHKFVILLNNKLVTYNKYEDIPDSFYNVISFLPEVPEAPHTEEQHLEIESWNDKLKELLKRETK
jgi:predicted alternative tryptophan synthase beta-subunit